MTDSLSQYCPNCEAQANTIQELRAANERWAIAFKLAEERAIDAVKALQADRAKLREEIIAILNQRIEDVRACKARLIWRQFMAVDEIDWLEETKAALQETGQ